MPGDGAKAILQNDQNILESVPPFSWFFQTNAEIAAIANGDTSYITPGGAAVYHINPAVSSTPSNGVAMTIMTGINGATSTFTLLPANPMTGFLADGRLIDDWYNLILTAFVCIVIIMMYKIIL